MKIATVYRPDEKPIEYTVGKYGVKDIMFDVDNVLAIYFTDGSTKMWCNTTFSYEEKPEGK